MYRIAPHDRIAGPDSASSPHPWEIEPERDENHPPASGLASERTGLAAPGMYEHAGFCDSDLAHHLDPSHARLLSNLLRGRSLAKTRAVKRNYRYALKRVDRPLAQNLGYAAFRQENQRSPFPCST